MRAFFNTAALDGTIHECEEVFFTCEAFGHSPPVRFFHLYHNEQLFIRGSRTGRFRIAEVHKIHTGRYSCVPENRLGLGFNRTMELRVIGEWWTFGWEKNLEHILRFICGLCAVWTYLKRLKLADDFLVVL